MIIMNERLDSIENLIKKNDQDGLYSYLNELPNHAVVVKPSDTSVVYTKIGTNKWKVLVDGKPTLNKFWSTRTIVIDLMIK